MKTARQERCSEKNPVDAPFFGRTVNGAFFSRAIQPKLALVQPNDKYEHEADVIADRVAQSGIQLKCVTYNAGKEMTQPLVQRIMPEEFLDRSPENTQQAIEGAIPESDELASRTQNISRLSIPQIQRAAAWVNGTVHETLNLASILLFGGAPITWEMLNGTILRSPAIAEGSINTPTIRTTGSGTNWTAEVTTVARNEGSFDETVLTNGPWRRVVPKATVGTRTGLAACTGAGNSTFMAIGSPSDQAIFEANRRHEDHHANDHRTAFIAIVVPWDRNLEAARSNHTVYRGNSDAEARANLWAAMGGTPQAIARSFHIDCGARGNTYHGTPAGGPMASSNPQANANCTTSSVDVINPS